MPRARIKLRQLSGFTLVEVLVALAIMAIMAALTWRGIDGMTRAQTATSRYTDDVLALQAGLTQWHADLDALMSWPGPDGAIPSTGAAYRRSLAWDGSVLRLTRMLTDTPDAGLRVVAWTRRGGDGQWLRWQSPPVLSQSAWIAAWDAAGRWGQTAPQGALPGGAQAVAIAGLQDWQLLYFRNNAWTNPLSSGAEGVNNTNALPDGVRLTITLAPGQSLSGPMQIDWVRPEFGAAQ